MTNTEMPTILCGTAEEMAQARKAQANALELLQQLERMRNAVDALWHASGHPEANLQPFIQECANWLEPSGRAIAKAKGLI